MHFSGWPPSPVHAAVGPLTSGGRPLQSAGNPASPAASLPSGSPAYENFVNIACTTQRTLSSSSAAVTRGQSQLSTVLKKEQIRALTRRLSQKLTWSSQKCTSSWSIWTSYSHQRGLPNSSACCVSSNADSVDIFQKVIFPFPKYFSDCNKYICILASSAFVSKSGDICYDQ